jgi:6-phosphogluconolactonase
MPAPDIRIARDPQQLAQEAATLLHECSQSAIKSHGRFLLALSGGSTPKQLYQTLAAPPWKQTFDWPHTIFLFGDERCVPPDHPESNYGMTKTTLLEPLGTTPTHIYRMKGEDQAPEAAAREYEATIRVITHCPAPAIPSIDAVLLGLGEDGHTASLFPRTAALQDCGHLVTVGQAPKGIPSRLTMTLAVLNQANVVLFLVAGTGKARIVRTVLEPKTEADRRLPAALVKPEQGRLIWLVDRPAAAELSISQ